MHNRGKKDLSHSNSIVALYPFPNRYQKSREELRLLSVSVYDYHFFLQLEEVFGYIPGLRSWKSFLETDNHFGVSLAAICMWKFASKLLAGAVGLRLRNEFRKLTQIVQEVSDDEASSTISKEDGLECPICCESFNIVENVPYVLWCGHSLCKNCVLSLHWAVVKIPTLPIQLPLLISCPWCSLLSPRLVLGGNLKFPCKNYFLLWMVERINNDKVKVVRSHTESCGDCQPSKLSSRDHQHRPSNVQRPRCSGPSTSHNYVIRAHSYVWKAVFFLVELTAKFPLVVIFLLIVLYAIPASAAVLALYLLLTVLFALPSFLVLYFSYPSLDWLVREIVA